MYTYRWCFKDPTEAKFFFDTLENYGDVPESRNSLQGHRYLKEPKFVRYNKRGERTW